MKYAIVICSGKQYKVIPGEIIQVDKLPLEVDKKVVLDEVLFIADAEKKVTIGTPLIKGAKVETTVAGQIKGPKIRSLNTNRKCATARDKVIVSSIHLLRVDKIVTKSGEKDGS